MAFLHQQPSRCLGFDVAKDSITISEGSPKAAVTITNSRAAIRAFLARRIRRYRPHRLRADGWP